MSAPNSQLERNKVAVRPFKESQGTKDEAAMLREVLAPNYTQHLDRGSVSRRRVGILLQLGAIDLLAGLGCEPLN